METRIEHWPLLSFKEYENDINPNPTYQRGTVWKPKQKQMLTDSVLRQIDIPKIYLRELEDENDYDFEIIDGQQRMRTLWDFLNNKFHLSDDIDDLLIKGKKFSVASCYYDDLPNKVRLERIHKYTLDVVIITNADEDEIADLFYRLNNGTPLSPAEVRNSIPGQMTRLIRGVANTYPFFEKTNFSGHRFGYHQVCAQMMMLELNLGLADIPDRLLTKMYFDHKKSVPTWAETNLKKNLRTLDKLFPEKSRLLNRASTINVYLLISYLKKKIKLSKEFFKLFLEWYQESEPIRRRDNEYKIYMTQAVNSRRSIENRFRMLLYDFYEDWDTGLSELDEKRNFDDTQKAEIYARDKGICQKCSKKVSEYKWHADHIKPWIEGGETTIENGQVLCIRCNLKKGSALWQ